MPPLSRAGLWPLAALAASACSTAGSAWMAEPLPGGGFSELQAEASASEATREATLPSRPPSRVIGRAADRTSGSASSGIVEGSASGAGGRSLGVFRNTYYDFPNEEEFGGPSVPVKDAFCRTITEVPRTFFETVCVQGSGRLKNGITVSFAKRDCECAEICPRSQQRICFETLDAGAFPWGRGATGNAITPLLTVAVDSDVIALGTRVYVPELDGLPRDVAGRTRHDGCFIAQDRGIRVKGKHLDVFTGQPSLTAVWNQLVPSNRGVTVIVDSPHCVGRAGSRASD